MQNYFAEKYIFAALTTIVHSHTLAGKRKIEKENKKKQKKDKLQTGHYCGYVHVYRPTQKQKKVTQTILQQGSLLSSCKGRQKNFLKARSKTLRSGRHQEGNSTVVLYPVRKTQLLLHLLILLISAGLKAKPFFSHSDLSVRLWRSQKVHFVRD